MLAAIARGFLPNHSEITRHQASASGHRLLARGIRGRITHGNTPLASLCLAADATWRGQIAHQPHRARL
eukprot:800876-Prymnesium_polylepis.1